MAVKLVIFLCFLVVFLQIANGCIFINEINPEMLAKTMLESDDVEDIRVATMLKKLSFTFPGTKWCGPGNVADGYDDLGLDSTTDTCCRTHDHCPETISGGESKYNLTNTALYTRLSCDCDSTFLECLKSADTVTSRLIGNIYFNSLKNKCFRKDFPVIKCTKKGGWFNSKCVEYSYDSCGEKVYQWFDVSQF